MELFKRHIKKKLNEIPTIISLSKRIKSELITYFNVNEIVKNNPEIITMKGLIFLSVFLLIWNTRTPRHQIKKPVIILCATKAIIRIADKIVK